MGSCGWWGHWGVVDFPSWDGDIISLGVATQKSPSSVPRLVSANYKTQWMTFTHGKKTSAAFLSFGSKRRSLRYNFGLGALPSSTAPNYNIVKTSQNVCDIFHTMWGSSVYGVNFNWDSIHEKEKHVQRNHSFNEPFQNASCTTMHPTPDAPPQKSATVVIHLTPQSSACNVPHITTL